MTVFHSIERIEARILDIPTIRPHKLAMHTMQNQTLVIVRLRCADGIEGLGEATTIGGMGHALPYLIPDFWTATIIAMIVVFVELWAIAWIQNKFMETPFVRAALQVVLGGALVFAAGALIGGG